MGNRRTSAQGSHRLRQKQEVKKRKKREKKREKKENKKRKKTRKINTRKGRKKKRQIITGRKRGKKENKNRKKMGTMYKKWETDASVVEATIKHGKGNTNRKLDRKEKMGNESK